MKYFDDFKVGDIRRFGSHTMTKEDVIAFASRYDPQPFHIDEAAAAAHPFFGRLSASGWHTACVTMRMIVDDNQQAEVAALGSPGLENLRWPSPTYPGDTLSVESEVLEMRRSQSRPGLGFLKSQNRTFNQNGEMVMEFTATIIFPIKPEE